MAQKILVVDDSRTVCRIVQWVFHASPYEVYAVHKGSDALEALEVETPHALLVDYWLPDGSGTDLVARIRRDARYSRMPIVVIGGRHHEFDESEVARSGAQGVIYKPFRTDDLIETVSQAVSSMAARPAQFTPDEPARALAVSDDVPAVAESAPLAMVDDDDDLGIELDAARDVSAEFDAVEPAPGEDDLFGDHDDRDDHDGAFAAEPAAADDDAAHADEPDDAEVSAGSGFRRLKPAGPPPVPGTGRFKKVGGGPLAPPPPRPLAGGAAPTTEPVDADAILSEAQSAVTTPQPLPPQPEPAEEMATQPTAAQHDDAFDDEPIAAQHDDAFDDEPAPIAAPEPAPAPEPVAEAPAETAPVAAASIQLAPADADAVRAAVQELLPGLVREALPGIVKEYLAVMLRQTGAKLEQYSEAKINQFCERDLPRMASEAIDAQLKELTGEG